MENSGKEESEEPREERSKVSTSKKTRRSVVRSFSWKKSKKLKMEETNKEQSCDGSVEVDAGSFEKREHAMSDEDVDLDETGSSSKKRKRFGVWKTMKRIFTRRSGKGSKSFTHGGSTTHTSCLHRSISDPNIISRSNPPEVAPLEQVDSAMQTEAVVSSPKKYLSHDSLISELRAKRGNSIGNKKQEDNRPENPSIIVSSETQGLNWQVSPFSGREKLVPGLNVSHDKIRVAPRHRRAPSRKGVASVRHHDRVEGNIPRSNSVGDSSPSFVLKKEPVDFGELIQSLRSHQGENVIIENKKEDIEVSMEEEPSSEQEETTKKSQERSETVSDEIHESRERDIIEKDGNVDEVLEVNELKETINEDKTMEITPATVETLEIKTKYGDEIDQQSVEETEKARKYSDHQKKSLPKHDETDTLVDITTVSLSKTTSTPVTEQYFKLIDDCVFGDNVDVSMSPITESVPVTNDKPAYKEAPGEELPVELIGSDPEPVPESISKSVNKGYVEVVLDNQKATTDKLPCPVSVSVSLELPDVDKDQDISKVEPEQNTSHSSSSDDDCKPSTNITNAIPESKSTDPSLVEATVTSPVRRRLNIVTPENVFQKPIMSKVVINENKSQQEPEEIQRRRPQSLYIPKLTNKLEEEGHSKDDSSAGVARLTEAFERTYRANTISLGERRKKPDVLPKPKLFSQSSEERVQTSYETRSLGRNFKLVKAVSKQMEEQIIINDDTVDQDVLDRNKINEKSDVVVKSPTKKPERRGTAPKPPPKPKIFKESKPALTAKNNITVLKDEGKEDVQGNSVPKPIRNGSTKISEKESLNDKINIVGENKDDQPVAALPSFWAKRSMFSSGSSPNVKPSTNSSDSSEEPMTTKEVAKPTPMFQVKTDTCVVCDSKVYQMEKLKVKDNVVHKRCVKCCSCKRKLSVGNVIMAENKIYCKLHEPSHTIALST